LLIFSLELSVFPPVVQTYEYENVFAGEGVKLGLSAQENRDLGPKKHKVAGTCKELPNEDLRNF